jgi:hypothetical protein
VSEETRKFDHYAPEPTQPHLSAPRRLFLRPRHWHFEYLLTFGYWLSIAGIMFFPLLVLSALDVAFGWDLMALTLVFHPWMVYVGWAVLALVGITLNLPTLAYYCPHCGARTNEGFDVCQHCGRDT